MQPVLYEIIQDGRRFVKARVRNDSRIVDNHTKYGRLSAVAGSDRRRHKVNYLTLVGARSAPESNLPTKNPQSSHSSSAPTSSVFFLPINLRRYMKSQLSSFSFHDHPVRGAF